MDIGEDMDPFKEYAIRGGVQLSPGACFSHCVPGIIHANTPENLAAFERLLRRDALWNGSNDGIMDEWEVIVPVSDEDIRSQPDNWKTKASGLKIQESD
jgi:hypothetical protein